MNNEILKILSQLIENPVCELNYNNNYELLCAVLLSAQTTDKRVNEVGKVLFSKYKNFYELKDANKEELIDIIKSLGLAKVKSENLINLAKIICEKYDGNVIADMAVLCSLPGVGRKTASVVLAVGFNIEAFAVDTHVMRVSKRLNITDNLDDPLKCEEKLKKYFNSDSWILAHHLLLLFGRYYCKAKNPKCDGCVLEKYCIRP